MYFLKLNSRELHDSRREKAQFSLTQLYPQNQTFVRNFRISRNSERVLGKCQGPSKTFCTNIEIPSPSRTLFEHWKCKRRRREEVCNLIFRFGKTCKLFKCVANTVGSMESFFEFQQCRIFPVNRRCPGMALAPKSPQQVSETSLRSVRKFLLCLRLRYICCRIIAINASS